MAILDDLDVIKNLESIYESDYAFNVLKDFERVIDELGLYVYANWEDGELISGPHISRHWVECSFMWPYKKMPDPAGGKRLLDYDCQVSYEKTSILKPRIIKKPDDFRTGTKKGKLDKIPVWHVNIKMPKKLLVDILGIDSDMQKAEIEQDAVGQVPMSAPAPTAVAPAPAPAAPVDVAPAPAPGAV